jgi:hypothetical protein
MGLAKRIVGCATTQIDLMPPTKDSARNIAGLYSGAIRCFQAALRAKRKSLPAENGPMGIEW